MTKFLAAALLAALLPHVAAEVIAPYQGKGCRYEGAVKEDLPQGQGVWSCDNGNRYEGTFKHGKFNGKGTFTVSGSDNVFLEPFGAYSSRFKGMRMEGSFQNGRANGVIQVYEGSDHIFTLTYDKGIMKEAKLPKKKK